MPRTLRIRVAENPGQITSLRYANTWSARLGGKLIGSGYCLNRMEAEERALDLVTPDEVDEVEIVESLIKD